MSKSDEKLLEFLEGLLNSEELHQDPTKMLARVVKAKQLSLEILDGILFCIKASPEARELGLKGLRRKFDSLKKEF